MRGIAEIISLVSGEYLQSLRATNQAGYEGRPHPSRTECFRLQGRFRIRFCLDAKVFKVIHRGARLITALNLSLFVKAKTLPSHVFVNSRKKVFA